MDAVHMDAVRAMASVAPGLGFDAHSKVTHIQLKCRLQNENGFTLSRNEFPGLFFTTTFSSQSVTGRWVGATANLVAPKWAKMISENDSHMISMLLT